MLLSTLCIIPARLFKTYTLKNLLRCLFAILATAIVGACSSVKLPKEKPPAKEVKMQSSLQSMIKRDKIDRSLRTLAAAPEQIFSTDSQQMTPLHHAALYNRYELVEALINAGALIDAADKRGDTPLHLAAYSHNIQSVELLLKAGAKVNIANKKKQTPVHKAAVFCGEEVFNMMFPQADFEAEDERKNRPLHVAAKYQNLSFVDKLLQVKVKESIYNSDGDDPLMAALKGLNSNELLETRLISRAQKAVFYNKNKETYLHAAATNGKAHAIKRLLAKGADVNARDSRGVTPIVRALRHRKKQAADILISEGADLSVVDEDGRTLLHMMAFWLNEKTTLDKFIRVIDVNSVDKRGRSPLHEIAYWGHVKNAIDIIASGAKVNLQANNGQTPIFDAVKSNNAAMTELLINRGTHINLPDASGDTVLKAAIKSQYKNLQVISLLLTAGANPNIHNKYGETALHEAVGTGDIDVVKLLMQHKARVTARDKFGKTPVDWAKDKKLAAIVAILQP